MELVEKFAAFLNETVNLNDTRIEGLETSVGAIRDFIRQSAWEPTVLDFWEQGSWAHDTIIRPVDKGEFDADLLVRVLPVDGWTAKDYIDNLSRTFRKSLKYKKKCKSHNYCVTITYANEKKIDISPLVVGRLFDGSLEVCNRKVDEFFRSEPKQYTDWLISKNAISGKNSFRKVTRLVKFLRDIKCRFVCSSVLLTTLLANQISEDDKGSDDFATTPRCLRTVFGRLDDWLQVRATKPRVENPFLSSEDFAEDWTESQYQSFRTSINRYRGWIDDACDSLDLDASIDAWRKLFGQDFAKGVVTKAAKLEEARNALASPPSKFQSIVDQLIDRMKTFGTSAIPKNYAHQPHMQSAPWQADNEADVEVIVSATVGGGPKHMHSRSVASGEILKAGPSIYFEAKRPDGLDLGPDYFVKWRVTNSIDAPQLRGDFYESENGTVRSEQLTYRGLHVAEAFVLRRRDLALVAVSDPFFVAID